jgi:hypothetical protein
MGRVRLTIAVKYRRDVRQRHRGKAAASAGSSFLREITDSAAIAATPPGIATWSAKSTILPRLSLPPALDRMISVACLTVLRGGGEILGRFARVLDGDLVAVHRRYLEPGHVVL